MMELSNACCSTRQTIIFLNFDSWEKRLRELASQTMILEAKDHSEEACITFSSSVWFRALCWRQVFRSHSLYLLKYVSSSTGNRMSQQRPCSLTKKNMPSSKSITRYSLLIEPLSMAIFALLLAVSLFSCRFLIISFSSFVQYTLNPPSAAKLSLVIFPNQL